MRSSQFPLIKGPATWPVPVNAIIAMVLLAALDLAPQGLRLNPA
jgi:hypothetical protein